MVLGELRLLVIAGPPLVPPSRLLDACRAAVIGGATAVQLRLKDTPSEAFLEQARALVESLPVPVFVNDRADIAWLSGAYGLHLGAEDLPVAEVRRVGPRRLCIGRSVGTPEEAEAARAAGADYWSIGSVYATRTKPDAGPPIGVDGFRRLAGRAPPGVSVIAIGGITAANLAPLIAAGAHGVAVGSAVFGRSDVERAAREMRRALRAGY